MRFDGENISFLKNIGQGELYYPRDISVDRRGYIYVADAGNNRIIKFDNEGAATGFNIAGLSDPYGVALDNAGNIYVADTCNHRIQKFDSQGNPLASIGAGQGVDPGKLLFPHGVAVDTDNNIYVADTNNHRIQKFSPS